MVTIIKDLPIDGKMEAKSKWRQRVNNPPPSPRLPIQDFFQSKIHNYDLLLQGL